MYCMKARLRRIGWMEGIRYNTSAQHERPAEDIKAPKEGRYTGTGLSDTDTGLSNQSEAWE